MSNKKLAFLAVALFMVMLAFGGGDCGGSGSGSAKTTSLTGRFYDGPVEGLAYNCTPSLLNGITNANGEYEYKAGDKVTFMVGNISLPEVNAAGVMTPLNYFSDKELDDPEVMKFVQFMLSAADVDANGNLTIKANPFDGETGTYSDALWDELDGKHLITATDQDAKDHVDNFFVVAFAGTYSGTFSGSGSISGYSFTSSGTWEVTIDAAGHVTGSYSWSGVSTAGKMTDNGPVTGTISPNGTAAMTAGGAGSSVDVAWSGQIDLVKGTMAGNYSGMNGYNESGTFTGNKE